MIIVDDVDQGSDQWLMLRLGIPTASNFSKIITPKGKPSTQRNAYLNKLLAEWVVGEPIDGYKSASMEYGNIMEDEARKLFEFINDVEIRQVSLIYGDDSRMIGASPDGLIGDDRGFEVKCPEAHTHIEYLLSDNMPNKYWPQVQGCMHVTGLDEWDFMSYFPGMPPLIKTIKRDHIFIRKLADELELFVDEMLLKRARLEALK